MGKRTRQDRSIWFDLREQMIQHGLRYPGQPAKLARYLNTNDSNVHRWLCPICEHDQEPSYSMGVKIEQYLASTPKYIPPIKLFEPHKTGRRCVICKTALTEGDKISGKVRQPDGKFKKVHVHLTCLVAFSKLN